MKKKFVRADTFRHSKLGKGRRKNQKWRKPKGRDNKIRESKAGHPTKVKIGFKNRKQDRNKINGREFKIIYNKKQLEEIKDKAVILSSKIGIKKRKGIIEEAKNRKIKILNQKKKTENENTN